MKQSLQTGSKSKKMIQVNGYFYGLPFGLPLCLRFGYEATLTLWKQLCRCIMTKCNWDVISFFGWWWWTRSLPLKAASWNHLAALIFVFSLVSLLLPFFLLRFLFLYFFIIAVCFCWLHRLFSSPSRSPYLPPPQSSSSSFEMSRFRRLEAAPELRSSNLCQGWGGGGWGRGLLIYIIFVSFWKVMIAPSFFSLLFLPPPVQEWEWEWKKMFKFEKLNSHSTLNLDIRPIP